jgi:hypothetical protein
VSHLMRSPIWFSDKLMTLPLRADS